MDQEGNISFDQIQANSQGQTGGIFNIVNLDTYDGNQPRAINTAVMLLVLSASGVTQISRSMLRNPDDMDYIKNVLRSRGIPVDDSDVIETTPQGIDILISM